MITKFEASVGRSISRRQSAHIKRYPAAPESGRHPGSAYTISKPVCPAGVTSVRTTVSMRAIGGGPPRSAEIADSTSAAEALEFAVHRPGVAVDPPAEPMPGGDACDSRAESHLDHAGDGRAEPEIDHGDYVNGTERRARRRRPTAAPGQGDRPALCNRTASPQARRRPCARPARSRPRPPARDLPGHIEQVSFFNLM